EIVESGKYVETDDVVVDGDFVNYTFEIADLSETLATKITINAMGREMVHEFNVDFTDYKSKEEIDKPVDGENPKDEEDPKDKEDPKEDPKEEVEDPNEEATLTPDKVYEINYTILNENGKTASVADGFFIKPGTLLEK